MGLPLHRLRMKLLHDPNGHCHSPAGDPGVQPSPSSLRPRGPGPSPSSLRPGGPSPSPSSLGPGSLGAAPWPSGSKVPSVGFLSHRHHCCAGAGPVPPNPRLRGTPAARPSAPPHSLSRSRGRSKAFIFRGSGAGARRPGRDWGWGPGLSRGPGWRRRGPGPRGRSADPASAPGRRGRSLRPAPP